MKRDDKGRFTHHNPIIMWARRESKIGMIWIGVIIALILTLIWSTGIIS